MNEIWEWLTGTDAANFGQFFGSMLTALSVLLALYIIIRDRRQGIRIQADQVSIWITGINQETVTLANHSNANIVNPTLFVFLRPERVWRKALAKIEHPLFREEYEENAPIAQNIDHLALPQSYPFGGESGIVRPGEVKQKQLVLDSQPYPTIFYELYLDFTDAAGRRWIRDFSSGKYLGRLERRKRFKAYSGYSVIDPDLMASMQAAYVEPREVVLGDGRADRLRTRRKYRARSAVTASGRSFRGKAARLRHRRRRRRHR